MPKGSARGCGSFSSSTRSVKANWAGKTCLNEGYLVALDVGELGGGGKSPGPGTRGRGRWESDKIGAREFPELPERRVRAAPALSTNSTEKRLPERPTQMPLSPASLMLLPQEGG